MSVLSIIRNIFHTHFIAFQVSQVSRFVYTQQSVRGKYNSLVAPCRRILCWFPLMQSVNPTALCAVSQHVIGCFWLQTADRVRTLTNHTCALLKSDPQAETRGSLQSEKRGWTFWLLLTVSRYLMLRIHDFCKKKCLLFRFVYNSCLRWIDETTFEAFLQVHFFFTKMQMFLLQNLT